MSLDVAAMKITWIQEQDLLRQKLVCTDDYGWTVPEKFGDKVQQNVDDKVEHEDDKAVNDEEKAEEDKAEEKVVKSEVDVVDKVDGEPQQHEVLRLIGGMDLSFIKEDPTMACSALVVMDISTMEVVYEDFEMVDLTMPYVPGFLAFRESPALLRLLEKLKNSPGAVDKYPQLLMIDGNGILHPRGFGLASHLGVLADVPTLGIGKTLFMVDGLDEQRVKRTARKVLVKGGDAMNLVGTSGKVWGSALRSTQECINPVFVSIGHRISLEAGVDIVRKCCQFRIPEPVRQADKKSREYLRVHGYTKN